MSITSVTPSVIAVGNATTPKGGVGSCGVTKVHWNPTPAFAPQAITAGGASVTINGTFSMDSDVEDACQNATFTLTVTVTGTMG
jgi:hypothetical protein